MMIPENYYEPRINVGEDLDLFLADFELWVFLCFILCSLQCAWATTVKVTMEYNIQNLYFLRIITIK